MTQSGSPVPAPSQVRAPTLMDCRCWSAPGSPSAPWRMSSRWAAYLPERRGPASAGKRPYLPVTPPGPSWGGASSYPLEPGLSPCANVTVLPDVLAWRQRGPRASRQETALAFGGRGPTAGTRLALGGDVGKPPLVGGGNNRGVWEWAAFCQVGFLRLSVFPKLKTHPEVTAESTVYQRGTRERAPCLPADEQL